MLIKCPGYTHIGISLVDVVKTTPHLPFKRTIRTIANNHFFYLRSDFTCIPEPGPHLSRTEAPGIHSEVGEAASEVREVAAAPGRSVRARHHRRVVGVHQDAGVAVRHGAAVPEEGQDTCCQPGDLQLSEKNCVIPPGKAPVVVLRTEDRYK